MKMNDATFNAIRWVVEIFLPALSTLYFGLSQFWPLPYVEQIVGTISVFTTFLGAVVITARKAYESNNQTTEEDEAE